MNPKVNWLPWRHQIFWIIITDTMVCPNSPWQGPAICSRSPAVSNRLTNILTDRLQEKAIKLLLFFHCLIFHFFPNSSRNILSALPSHNCKVSEKSSIRFSRKTVAYDRSNKPTKAKLMDLLRSNYPVHSNDYIYNIWYYLSMFVNIRTKNKIWKYPRKNMNAIAVVSKFPWN